MRFLRNLELKGPLILYTGNSIFHTKISRHFGGLCNSKEFCFSFLGLSSDVSIISGVNYSLSLVTIVNKLHQ